MTLRNIHKSFVIAAFASLIAIVFGVIFMAHTGFSFDALIGTMSLALGGGLIGCCVGDLIQNREADIDAHNVKLGVRRWQTSDNHHGYFLGLMWQDS